MQRKYKESALAFRDDITRFISSHWRKDEGQVTARQLEIWRLALVERGWSVPDWPEHAGGPGWTPTQKYLWQQVCADYGVIDSFGDNPAIAIVGPLLFTPSLGSEKVSTNRQWLQGIRDLQDRWCIGYAERDCGTNITAMSTSATKDGDGYRIQGSKVWVAEALGAQWMCLLARVQEPELGNIEADNFALFAVDLLDPGVTVTLTKTLDGSSSMAQVDINNVLVPTHHVLGESGRGEKFGDLIHTSLMSSVSRGAIAQAQLAQLDAHLHSFDTADPIYTKRHAVAVELATLEALELRYVDALERNIEAPFPINVLRVKSRAIQLQLGALQMECFGYYALPYPDEVLLHNEGPIGPKGAITAMRTALAQQVAQLYEGSVEAMKDQLAADLDIDAGSATKTVN